jgi:hypothetical protein
MGSDYGNMWTSSNEMTLATLQRPKLTFLCIIAPVWSGIEWKAVYSSQSRLFLNPLCTEIVESAGVSVKKATWYLVCISEPCRYK